MNAVKKNQVIVTGDGNQFEKISISEKNDGLMEKENSRLKDELLKCKDKLIEILMLDLKYIYYE